MKILLSAYVFAPNGSESAVGWNWAMALVNRGHEVWVMTREWASRGQVEAHEREFGLPSALHIVYVDWPYDRDKKFVNRLPMNYYWHYFAWQKHAYERARILHEREGFDLVQHITWVSLRTLSHMGKLGIPFIYGPVGGGERTPRGLRRVLDLKGRIGEAIRDKTLQAGLLNPGMNKMFEAASKIYVTSEQTQNLVPERFHHKSDIALAIGLDVSSQKKTAVQRSETVVNLLFVGRFLSWKGMALGLRSFAIAQKEHPSLRLTMVGKGPEKQRWQQLARSLGIADLVRWIDWVDQKQLAKIYADHHLFLLPSFHDSGGLVILESMAHGLPVLCLDIGGPGTLVNKTCGRALETTGKTSSELVQDMAQFISEVARSPKLYDKLSQGALARADAFTWDKVVGRVYEEFEQAEAISREDVL